MRPLRLSARVYVAGVIAAGTLVLGLSLLQASFHAPWLFGALLLLSSTAAARNTELPLAADGSAMSVSYVVDFVSLLLLGPHETTIIAAASVFSQCHFGARTRNPCHRTLFSMAAIVLAVEGAGDAIRVLGGISGPLAFATLVLPVAGAATVYCLLNTWLVAGAIALTTDARIRDVWRDRFLRAAPSYFLGAGAAAIAAVLVAQAGYWVAPFTAAPLYLSYRTYKVYMGRLEDEEAHAQRTSDLHLATIEALARAIDAKDQTAQMHIRREQAYAAGLAKAAGLSAFDIEGVKTAALLHDIGKLAVPEHILSKPGPLTQEEFLKVRIHPQVGAEIIAAVPFPYPVAPLIRCHHERWDGKGYPQGLAGEQIPLGARILSLVDYYDAVTTERPYHPAMSSEDAIGLLRREAGRALDPRLVDLFIEVLPTFTETLETEAQPTPHAQGGDATFGSTAAGLVPARPASAFENIALAHREIYALYEIAQAMGTSLGVSDTMTLISSKLAKIVPWSGCALFLQQPDGESLRCQFAAGLDAPRLLDAMLRHGEGLAGWVARTRRSIVNGEPRMTFLAAGLDEDTALRSALVCPLHSEDGFIGCLALYHVEVGFYTEDHRRLLERIGEQAGAVIHNSIVFEQTQEESLTDPLTGLPNRRSLFAHLGRELSRAERIGSEIALIVIDIDGFKAINDSYGHSVGDGALREVAWTLLGVLRPYDLCVRYAGDEFIVVLTDCSRQAADAKRHELQERIGDIELEVRPGKRVRLAASAGAAVYPHDGTTYEKLLTDADCRMYRDKAARRREGLVAQMPGSSVPATEESQPAAVEPIAPLP